MKKIDKIMISNLMSQIIEIWSTEKMLKLIRHLEILLTSQIMGTRSGKISTIYPLKLANLKKNELKTWTKLRDSGNSVLIENVKMLISSKELEQLTMIWQRHRNAIKN